MKIKPSAAIRDNYNKIAEFCFTRRESMLKLSEHLGAIEEDRLNGKLGFSIEETVSLMQKAVIEATHDHLDHGLLCCMGVGIEPVKTATSSSMICIQVIQGKS